MKEVEQINTQKMNSEATSIIELIKTLWNRKWIIVAITVLCLVVTFVYSFIIQKDEFLSIVTLSTQPSEDPNYTMESYLQQLKSTELLTKTAEILSKNGINVSVATLDATVSAVAINENTFQINVTNQNSKLAANIANTLADNFIPYITEQVQKDGNYDVEEIEKQLAEAEKDMTVYGDVLNAFIKQNKGISYVQAEIDGLKSLLARYNISISEIKSNIETNEAYLYKLYTHAKDADVQFPDKVEIEISSVDKSMDIVNPSDGKYLTDVLLRVEILDIQEKLLEDKSRENALMISISDLQDKLIEREHFLSQNEYRYNTQKSDYEFARDRCYGLRQNLQNAQKRAISRFGEDNIKILTRGVEAQKPIESNRKKNMIIALVLGLVLGAGVVLLRSFWIKERAEKNK